MNEPDTSLKRREFLKKATPVAALAMGAPGWRSGRAAEPDADAAISERLPPGEPGTLTLPLHPDRHSAGYVSPRNAGGPTGCGQGMRTRLCADEPGLRRPARHARDHPARRCRPDPPCGGRPGDHDCVRAGHLQHEPSRRHGATGRSTADFTSPGPGVFAVGHFQNTSMHRDTQSREHVAASPGQRLAGVLAEHGRLRA